MPFVYFTDGGVDSNSYSYFMHQLFGEGTHCYSSLNVQPSVTSVHLQAYLGREVAHQLVTPNHFLKNASNPYVLQMPIEQFVLDKEEQESFKQIKILTIDKRIMNYTAFCKTFMLFTNEKEVSIQSSQVLKAFHMVNSVKAFLALGLPLKKSTQPDGLSCTDPKAMHENQSDHSVAFEIDLSNPKAVKRALGLTNLDCLPILWCFQD